MRRILPLLCLTACATTPSPPIAYDGLTPIDEPGGPRLEAQGPCHALTTAERGVLVGTAIAGLFATLGGLASMTEPEVSPGVTVALTAGGGGVAISAIAVGLLFDRCD